MIEIKIAQVSSQIIILRIKAPKQRGVECTLAFLSFPGIWEANDFSESRARRPREKQDVALGLIGQEA